MLGTDRIRAGDLSDRLKHLILSRELLAQNPHSGNIISISPTNLRREVSCLRSEIFSSQSNLQCSPSFKDVTKVWGVRH